MVKIQQMIVKYFFVFYIYIIFEIECSISQEEVQESMIL